MPKLVCAGAPATRALVVLVGCLATVRVEHLNTQGVQGLSGTAFVRTDDDVAPRSSWHVANKSESANESASASDSRIYGACA